MCSKPRAVQIEVALTVLRRRLFARRTNPRLFARKLQLFLRALHFLLFRLAWLGGPGCRLRRDTCHRRDRVRNRRRRQGWKGCHRHVCLRKNTRQARNPLRQLEHPLKVPARGGKSGCSGASVRHAVDVFSTTKGTHPTEGNDTLGAGFLRYMACASKC